METQTFSLDGHDYIELIKLLKATGLCESGGQAKQAVSEGLVKVNGELEERKRRKCRLGDTIHFEGATVKIC